MTGRFLRVIEFLDQNFLIMTDTYFAVPSVFPVGVRSILPAGWSHTQPGCPATAGHFVPVA